MKTGRWWRIENRRDRHEWGAYQLAKFMKIGKFRKLMWTMIVLRQTIPMGTLGINPIEATHWRGIRREE